MTTKTTQRILWTEEERTAVARAVYQRLLRGEDRLTALRGAQVDALPSNRQRGFSSTTNTTIYGEWHKIQPMLNALRKEAETGTSAPPPPPPLPAFAEEAVKLYETLDAVPPPTILPPTSQPAQPRPVIELLGELVAALLVQPAVRDALSNIGRSLLSSALTGTLPEERSAPPILHDAEKPVQQRRLPVVLMIGFKPDQRAPFERRYADAIRFKWWYDESMQQLQDKARMADAVFATMGACSHQAVAAVHAIGQRVRRVSAGTSEMMQQLDAWTAEQRAAATVQQ